MLYHPYVRVVFGKRRSKPVLSSTEPEGWNMTVLQPQTTERRTTRTNHPASMLPTFDQQGFSATGLATLLYSTILYHTLPYYSILYHTIPYHTLLYYTIPYRLSSFIQDRKAPFHRAWSGRIVVRICEGPELKRSSCLEGRKALGSQYVL